MKKSLKITLLSLISLLVVAGIAVAVYLLTRPHTPSAGEPTGPESTQQLVKDEADGPEPNEPPKIVDTSRQAQIRKETNQQTGYNEANTEKTEAIYTLDGHGNYRIDFKALAGATGQATTYVVGGKGIICYKQDNSHAFAFCLEKDLTSNTTSSKQGKDTTPEQARQQNTYFYKIQQDPKIQKVLKPAGKESCPGSTATCYVWEGSDSTDRMTGYTYRYTVDKKGRPVKITKKSDSSKSKSLYTTEITYYKPMKPITLPADKPLGQ